MPFKPLVNSLTKVCHEAIDDGDSIEEVVAALHVVHESAMLTYKRLLSEPNERAADGENPDG